MRDRVDPSRVWNLVMEHDFEFVPPAPLLEREVLGKNTGARVKFADGTEFVVKLLGTGDPDTSVCNIECNRELVWNEATHELSVAPRGTGTA